MTQTKFEQRLQAAQGGPLKARELKILQANLGYRCNMACKHCHVQGGPDRTEVMDEKTAREVLHVVANHPFETLDLTGGSPELNPSFRMLVAEARKAGRRVIVRTNLTVLFEPGMEGLAEFYCGHQVELIASLPFYLEDGVDRVRGSGTFLKSINALKMLNSLGYGCGAGESNDLPLNLVYNPQGMFLPPAQEALETEYRRSLKDRFGLSFTRLYAFANMPIGRFRNFLERTGNLDRYLDKLAGAFNPAALDKVMCRHILSVGWNGTLYDCDFNQVLDLPAQSPAHRIEAFDYDALSDRVIAAGEHCFGCTAGQGSS